MQRVFKRNVILFTQSYVYWVTKFYGIPNYDRILVPRDINEGGSKEFEHQKEVKLIS